MKSAAFFPVVSANDAAHEAQVVQHTGRMRLSYYPPLFMIKEISESLSVNVFSVEV